MARAIAGAAGNYLANSAAAVTAVPLTMACWVRPANVTTYYTLMNVQIRPKTFTDEYFVLGINGSIAGDPVICETAAGGAYAGANTSTSYTANTWHHACAVFSATNSRSVYLNGGGKATDTTTLTPSGISYTQLGGFTDGTTSFDGLNGRIAEAAFWNAALTDAEVLSLARGASPMLVRPDALVSYWPLIGRFSPEPDRVGGLPLTITGTVTQAEHTTIVRPRPPMYFPFAAAVGGGTVGGLLSGKLIRGGLLGGRLVRN